MENVIERTHREINEARVRRGELPVDFGDQPSIKEEAASEPSTTSTSRVCQCGCGQSMAFYRESWKFLRGHKPRNGHTPRPVVRQKNALPSSLKTSGDMSSVVAVMDQQIAALGLRLTKLREARTILQGL